ncbi:S-adenosyl-L-methionine-dependent methyltransferase [Xylariaceae sp. FL0804]|nr:S-adenosyl-L-methionine-dependent methyltransferase [Xylariaceae sp. FL0804]
MSAPSIPNLLSLRGGSRGGGARGRGRGRPGGHSSPAASSASHDATIQGTDTDAAVSRLSAVHLGYLDDPFAHFFVQQQQQPGPAAVVGTYTRTAALDRLIDGFLAGGSAGSAGRSERQIVSLGAGTDTRSFKLLSRPGQSGLVYHEVDFPAVTSRKLRITKSAPSLSAVMTGTTDQVVNQTGSWSAHRLQNGCQYWCHGLDLRDLSGDDPAPLSGLRTDIPTVLISECCLCYLQVPEAKKVVEYFVDRIPNLSLIVYEPTNPEDPFGRQMVSNLAARNIRMPTLEEYSDTSKQERRLQAAGFDRTRSMTIEKIWEQWISAHEQERVNRLEGLDEVEEWSLLADHYVVVWGWRGEGFEAWGEEGDDSTGSDGTPTP